MKFKLSDKARRVIETVAPTIGVALGGPLGGLAGQMVAEAVGAKDENGHVDSAKVEQALATQSPEVLLALRKGEQEFTVRMDELGIERDKLVISDRADARSLAKVDMRPQIWISILFIGGYFILLCALLLGDVQLEGAARDQFTILIGVLTASVTSIMAFWFGSTAGSAQKTKLLADSAPAKTQN